MFVTGLSAGGAMTASLAATYPDLFAGGGDRRRSASWGGVVHGGGLAGDVGACAPDPGGVGRQGPPGVIDGAAWPVISIWHGEADSTVRPAAADALVGQWTDVHAVVGPPTPARTPDGRRFEVWRTREGRVVVEHHRFPSMGHGTSVKAGGGANGTAGAFILEVGTASSLEIAMGWGIATAPVAAPIGRQDTTAFASKEPSQTRSAERFAAAPRGAPSLSDTIEKALRTAGLL